MRSRHPPSTKLHRATDLVAIAVAVMLIGLLDLGGVFQPADNVAYDIFLRTKSRLSQIPARVMVVYVDAQVQSQAPLLAELTTTLRGMGASQVAFAFPAPTPIEAMRPCLKANPLTFFGRPTTRSLHDPSVVELRPLPREVLDVPHGVLYIPPSTDGIHRSGATTLKIWEREFATLELATARAAHIIDVEPSLVYRVDFRGGVGSLPQTNYEDVMSGSIVPELVADRVMLIAASPEPDNHGLTTPMTKGVVQMSAAEYHAHALNSLLCDSLIRELGSPFRFVYVIGGGIALTFLYRRCELSWTMWLAPFLLLITAVVSVGGLIWFGLWVPWIPLATLQLVSVGHAVVKKVSLLRTTLQQVSLDQSTKTRQRRWPSNLVTAADPWPEIVDFVMQLVPTRRLVTFEAHYGQMHLREARSVGCTFEDVAERRRDYSRDPYAKAVKIGTPMRIEPRRPFLNGITEDRAQFLLPFCHAGEVFGFMAIEASDSQEWGDFHETLDAVTQRVSDILYRRRCLRPKPPRKRLGGVVGVVTEAEEMDQLQRNTRALEQRLIRLEHMFQTADTASVIYDVYGQLLMVNDRMSEILKRENVAAAKCNAIELIMRLSGCPEDTARTMFREVVLAKNRPTITARLSGSSGNFSVVARVLQSDALLDSAGLVGRFEALEVWGIQLDVVDHKMFDTFDWLEKELDACNLP